MTTFLTLSETAERLGVTVETVTALIKTGALEAVNIGVGAVPRYRVTEAALENFAVERAVSTGDAA